MIKSSECLQVVWKDLDTRQRVIIGTLCKEEHYTFKYKQETLEKAKKLGFKGLVAFQDFNKEYANKSLFPAFATRLPDKRRTDIKEILENYNLTQYDAFELLKRTEGRLPIDTLEFIEAINLEILDDVSQIKKEFFVAGVRHCEVCEDRKDNNCTIKIPINIGEQLELILDEDNKFDRNAVMLYKDKKKVGFIPNYYSEAIHDSLINNLAVKCVVVEFNEQNCCQECLKVVLTITKE